jgi:large subunit ribosomal protein L3
MKFILGKKLKMTQLFGTAGQAQPVTLVEAGPCWVTQLKTADKDSYAAVQIGFGTKKDKQMKRAQAGHFKKAAAQNPQVKNLKYLKEFRTEDSGLELGKEIRADIFKEGDKVKVSGLSKGKGFAGVVKRHGFGGGPKTHGQKHSLRAPGSIGATFPERVPKGRRMAGRMGFEQTTTRGLKIVRVDADNNVLAILGAIPGRPGTLVVVQNDDRQPTDNKK